MPKRETAARRYAEAGFEIARSEGQGALERWEADLAALREALDDPRLRAVVEHPAVPYRDKERVLRRVMPNVGKGPLSLVLLMIRRGRPGAVARMMDYFATLVRRQRGVQLAEVRTALALGEEERAAIARRIGELTGQRVEMNEIVDESLIGGVAVRIGDQLYDASVRSRLERLRARLTAV
jgi:F-type H+-transporting ATPase subunit delta